MRARSGTEGRGRLPHVCNPPRWHASVARFCRCPGRRWVRPRRQESTSRTARMICLQCGLEHKHLGERTDGRRTTPDAVSACAIRQTSDGQHGGAAESQRLVCIASPATKATPLTISRITAAVCRNRAQHERQRDVGAFAQWFGGCGPRVLAALRFGGGHEVVDRAHHCRCTRRERGDLSR